MSDRTGGAGGRREEARRTDRQRRNASRTYGRPRPDERRRGDVAFRRTLVVTLLSVVAPGSGHLALKRRAVGRIALRTYLLLVAVAVLLAVFVPRTTWLSLAFKPWLLGFVQGLAVVVGVLWVGVVLHAFLLSGPRRISWPRNALAAVLALVLCAGIFAPFGVASKYAAVQRDLVTSMFPDQGEGPKGRMNVLLIGGDAGRDRTGVRTDSMILASTDLATGRTALISLPRNLQHVPMPDGPAEERFPGGFTDLLNAVYQYGQQHPDVVPGAENPGAELLKQTVGEVLDLPVHYYVLVNLKGFTQMVDALGGVTVTVKERLPIGGGSHPVTGYVEAGRRKLNGKEALWYARSRASSSDYDRMARQRCLLGAFADQADPATVLARYQQLAAASKKLFRTDIPQNVMSELVGVAQKAQRHKIRSIALVPPLVDTSDPDWRLIRKKTDKTIEASTKDQPRKQTEASKVANREDTGGSAPDASPTGDVAVDDACR